MKKFLFLLTTVCALIYAPPVHAWKIYLQLYSTPAETPRLWAWGDDGDIVTGTTNNWANRPTMTPEGDNLYSYTSTPEQSAKSFSTLLFTIGTKESGQAAFRDGAVYGWNGQNKGLMDELHTWTFYFDKSNFTDAPDGDWIENDAVYFFTDGTANYYPSYTLASPLQCQNIDGTIYRATITCMGTPHGQFISGPGETRWSNRTEPIAAVENSHLYRPDGTRHPRYAYLLLTHTPYTPRKVTLVELIKDGAQFKAAVPAYDGDTMAPVTFALNSLTGTGVYTINVTCGDGTTETVTKYFATRPSDTGSPLAVADRDNTFQLNARDSEKIISNADMTINFDGLTATDYTLSGVQYLSHVAQVTLIGDDGEEAATMEHRQDGKYVCAGFIPAANKKYAVRVMLPNNSDTGYETTCYTISNATTIENHIYDAEEIADASIGSEGFTFGSTDPTNVSVRLVMGKATKISLGDNHGFVTVYFRKPFADWTPYVRLSSSTTQGYWWKRMTRLNGRTDLYYVSFDPHLYNMVRFFSNDYFDIPEAQTERVAVEGNEILYKVAHSSVVTSGAPDKIGLPLTLPENFTVPYIVTAVKLIDTADGSTTLSMSLDDVGNWTAPLPADMGGSYRIEVTGADNDGNALTKLYTVDGGSLATASGAVPVTEMGGSSDPFTIDLSGASRSTLTLIMSANGCVPEQAAVIDPAAGITAMRVTRCDGRQTFKLTPSNDGQTWTWEGIGIKTSEEADSKPERSYQLEVVNSGITQRWYFMADDHPLTRGETYPESWQPTTDNQHFRFSGDDGKYKTETMITVSLTPDKQRIASMTIGTPPTPPRANVYMPLTEGDFKNGPRYFLVGNRTADWRLQPEWELKPDGDGNVTLSGRLMYQQAFGIAKVENYANYTTHHYTLFANEGYDVTAETHTAIPLTSLGSADGIRYDLATDNPHPDTKRLRWKVDNADWTPTSWNTSSPTLLKKVTVTLDSDGNPAMLDIDYSTDVVELGNARTITLTGENIRYQGEYTFSDGKARNLAMMTPGSHLAPNDGDVADRWGDAWVQTDANGRPYVDGNGDLIYNTAFDSDWLSKHLVRFYNQEKELEYSSLNTTFFPADPEKETDEYLKRLYLMHPMRDGNGYNEIGGGKVREYDQMMKYTEVFHEDFKNGRESISNSGWQCYVAKDMWLDGEFKLWTGWGGNMKKYNYVNDGVYETAQLWFHENGGHQDGNTTKTVNGFDVSAKDATVILYPTRRDKPQANFRIDGMTYYSRVILWYNPNDGFDNSVLQLVRPIFGPNIQAFPNLETRNTFRYEWWIDSKKDETDNDDVAIDTYTVTRHRVIGTTVGESIEVKTQTAATDRRGTTVGSFKDEQGYIADTRKISFKDDAAAIDPGQYVYVITVNFTNGDMKSATSNVVTINETSIPVTLRASQRKDTKSNYEFGVDLTMRPSPTTPGKTVGDTGKTVAELMTHYVLVAGDPTASRLNAAANPDGIKFKQAAANEVLISDGGYLPAGTWHCIVPIQNADNAEISTRWDNTPPNASGVGTDLKQWVTAPDGSRGLAAQERDYVAPYLFRAYLMCDENHLGQWAAMNFDVASTATDVIAPATTLELTSIDIAKADESLTHDPRATATHTDHPSGTRLYNAAKAGDPDACYDIKNPIVYKRLNRIEAVASAQPLKVSADVVNKGVDYDLYIAPAGTDITRHYNNPTYHARLTTSADPDFQPNETTNLRFRDLDISAMGRTTSIDESHDDVIDILDDAAKARFDSHILVTYRLGGRTYVNTVDPADRDIEFNPSLDSENWKPSVGNIVYARYHDRYYHNGPEGTNNPDTEPCTCGQCTKPGHESLGHYAHAVIDFNVGGIDTETRNGYVSFHVQQKVKYDNGCYREHADWYKHSFAGTRAANGGTPVGDWITDFTQNGNVKISPLGHGGITYAEFDDKDGEAVWDDRNDWSTLAAKSGHLPLHINPVHQFTGENDYNFAPDDLTARFAAIYPVITGNDLGVELVNDASSRAPSRVGTPLAAPRAVSSVALFGANKEVTVKSSDWREAELRTGVEDILGDSDDTTAQYYNLQGIRVARPAKGQVYIVRRGSKVSKMLYR